MAELSKTGSERCATTPSARARPKVSVSGTTTAERAQMLCPLRDNTDDL